MREKLKNFWQFIKSKLSRRKEGATVSPELPKEKLPFRAKLLNFLGRFRPRAKVRWIITAFLWFLIALYVGVGIYEGIQIYSKHSNNSVVKFLTGVYPFPAAFVNGKFIWAKDYYKHLNYITNYYKNTNTNYSAEEARKKVMDRLVEIHIIGWEAAKYDIRVSSKDVNDVYQQIVQDKGEAEVQKVIRGLFNISVKEFKQLIAESVVEEKVQNELIEQVKVSHILVKDEARANEVLNKLKSGEGFDTLAKTYSEDLRTRDSAGDLGWIARGNLKIDGKLVPEIEEAMFKVKVDELYGPVKSQAGYDVGKVFEKKGKIQKSYADWLKEITEKAKIVIFIK